MNEKKILIIVAIILIIAFFALSFREAHLANPASHNWWSLSFASQEATDGSFSISNFGATRTFFYEVTTGKTLIKSDSFTTNTTNKEEVSIQNPDKKPIRVKVWTENDENKESEDLTKRKEIYKR